MEPPPPVKPAGGGAGPQQPPTLVGFRTARVLAMVLGLAMLCTYNFLLNLLPALRDAYAFDSFPYYAVLALTYPGIAVQFLMLPFGHLVPVTWRIRGPLVVQLVLLAILPVVAGDGGYQVGLLLLAASGVATAVMEASLFGYFSAFPPAFNGALVSGQGLAGVLASVIQIATRAAIPREPATATLVYCVLGAVIMAGSVAAHMLLVRLPFARAVIKATAARRGSRSDDSSGTGDDDEEGGDGSNAAISSSTTTAAETGAAAPPLSPPPLPVLARVSTLGELGDGGVTPAQQQRYTEEKLRATSESSSGGIEPDQPPPPQQQPPSSQWQRLHAVRQMTVGRGGGSVAVDGSASSAAAVAVPNPLQQLQAAAAAGAASPDGGVEAWGSPGAAAAAARHRAATPAAGAAAGQAAADAAAAPTPGARAGLRASARVTLRAARRESLAHEASAGGIAAAAALACPSAAAWCADFSRVLRVVAIPAGVLLANFVATFLPFPALLASVPYKGSVPGGVISAFTADDGWWFVVLLLVYGVFDVAGRLFAGRHPPMPEWGLVCYALVRFGWTGLIAGCAYSWAPAFDDAMIVFAVSGFAFTNGHLATLCFMQGPTKAAPADRELAGFVLAACLHVGIVCGSNAALLFTL
jgi:hypothetical protein